MEVIIKITIDDGVKTTEEATTPKPYSRYAKFFDESCPNWVNDQEYNLAFLKHQEAVATEKLRAQGYLFLNEVYQMLGLSRTKAGQIVGWIYDLDNPTGDNYVDFGLYDEKSKEFINGCRNTVLLDFNVDGLIFDKFS